MLESVEVFGKRLAARCAHDRVENLAQVARAAELRRDPTAGAYQP
jgi:hypothetical protein